LGGSVHTVKKNAEALVVIGKEIGLAVIVYEAKYVLVSLDQNAGRSHRIKINNCCFQRVEEFKYLGRTFNKSKFYSGRN